MEKAAEVYTRLKSRVLGPKMEAIQKANKAGPEKDKGDVEKGQEKLSGGETQNEKGEEETNAGNVPCTSQGGSLLCLDVWQSQGCAQGTAGPPVDHSSCQGCEAVWRRGSFKPVSPTESRDCIFK